MDGFPDSVEAQLAAHRAEAKRLSGLISKGKKKPVFRRPKAPYNDTELRWILRIAPTMNWNLRSSVATDSSGEYGRGFDFSPNPEYVDHTVRVLLATAVHVSLLGGLKPAMIDTPTEGRFTGRATITWVRTKRDQNVAKVPVPDDMIGWLPGYLNLRRPRSGDAYLDLFGAWKDEAYLSDPDDPLKILKRPGLAQRIVAAGGPRININSLRFRHTAIVGLKRRFNLTDQETATMARTSVKTVQRYATEDAERVIARIFAQGYDKLVA